MTAPQESLYWREWAALGRVFKARGEAVPDRAETHRLALLECTDGPGGGRCPACEERLAAGDRISHKEFENHFLTKWLGWVRTFTRPAEIQPQLHQQRDEQRRVKMRWKATVEQVRLLAAFGDSVTQWQREGNASRYIEAILRNRFKRNEDLILAVKRLSDRELCQLVMTVDRCIDRKRQAKGWTQADLRLRAGLGIEQEATEATEGVEVPF